jgi:hypothetical protein
MHETIAATSERVKNFTFIEIGEAQVEYGLVLIIFNPLVSIASIIKSEKITIRNQD